VAHVFHRQSDLELNYAEGPAKAPGDSMSMKQHPLPDQIAADRYPLADDSLSVVWFR
jgi:hypothetical protein